MEKITDISILDEQLFTLREAAKICRVSSQTLIKEIEEGRLMANKIRKHWKVFEKDLIEYLEKTTRTKKPNSPKRQARP